LAGDSYGGAFYVRVAWKTKMAKAKGTEKSYFRGNLNKFVE